MEQKIFEYIDKQPKSEAMEKLLEQFDMQGQDENATQITPANGNLSVVEDLHANDINNHVMLGVFIFVIIIGLAMAVIFVRYKYTCKKVFNFQIEL